MTWRVVVTGSECTGKTTLALAIAAQLGAPCVAEPSRAYAEAKGGVLTAADVEPIAEATIAAMAAWERGRGAGVVVFDTDLVSTLVYARAYYGSCPEWIEGACRERLGDLYLLCATDIPWVADGIRDRPSTDDRAAMHGAFERTLRALGARVVTVAGTGEARLDAAMRAVRAVRGAQPQEPPVA